MEMVDCSHKFLFPERHEREEFVRAFFIDCCLGMHIDWGHYHSSLKRSSTRAEMYSSAIRAPSSTRPGTAS